MKNELDMMMMPEEQIETTVEETEKKRTEDISDEVIKQMIMSPSSRVDEAPTFKETEEGEKEETEPIFSKKDKVEYTDKYKSMLVEKAIENPKMVMIETPEGEMTIDEAVKRGYNPETGEFDDPLGEGPRLEDYMNLDPESMAKMKRMFDPRSMDVHPDEAERMGMDMSMHPDMSPEVQPGEYLPEEDEELMSLLGG